MATEWMDNLLNQKISKEAMDAVGKDAKDTFERKVQAHDWIKSVSDLDPVAVEAEYQAKLAAEAMTLGKTASSSCKKCESPLNSAGMCSDQTCPYSDHAQSKDLEEMYESKKQAALVASFEDIKAETGVTPTEVVNNDFQRDVRILSDYALAEMLAEARGHKAQNSSEMFYELKEKAKKDVASSREKAEKALLDLIPDHTQLDWQKAFKEFTKEAKPEEPKEKDLFKTEVPDKAHNFQNPTEEKFKLPKDQEEAIPGNGREADERTEVTEEAGVLKDDITKGLGKEAEFQPKTGEPCSCKPGVARDNCPSCEGTGQKVDFKQIREKKEAAVEKKADYEGWVNQETWAVALWLDNDQGLYQAVQEAKSTIPDVGQFAQWLQTFVEEQRPDLGATLWNDMLSHGLANVKWYDIAAHEMEKEASKLPRVEKTADGPSATDNCPVCGSQGTDLNNGQMDHLSCQACGLTYASKEPLSNTNNPDRSRMTEEEHRMWDARQAGEFGKNRPSLEEVTKRRHEKNEKEMHPGTASLKNNQEITAQASKEEVIKIIKKAEVSSPWRVILDVDGKEVIARIENETKTEKVSEEDKTEELQK